ncbi:MAG: hypothetical protein AAFX06_11510 [Planctomycetota bacterium]
MVLIEWEQRDLCLQTTVDGFASVAGDVYDRTCRADFSQPGFCVLKLGTNLYSHEFRQIMVELKSAMAKLHEAAAGKTLSVIAASRFDQQTSTKPHVDGGPDENFLMLGYEPSVVHSELEISDYSKCAFDRGISPREFLKQHNPMFQSGFEMLRPYSTKVPCFSGSEYQIVCINNSTADYSSSDSAWQGTLHTATVPHPDESQRRVINSMMIASVAIGTGDAIPSAQLEEFVTATAVSRRGYDKPHLQDDK